METAFYLTYVALWILMVFHSLVILGLARMVYQLQQTNDTARNPPLVVGKTAPTFNATDLSGALVNSADISGQARVILFVSPTCSSCIPVLENDMQYLHHKGDGNLLLVCRAKEDECRDIVDRFSISVPVIADEDDAITRLFGVQSVPMAVFITPDDRIRSFGKPKRDELELVAGSSVPIEAQTVAVDVRADPTQA